MPKPQPAPDIPPQPQNLPLPTDPSPNTAISVANPSPEENPAIAAAPTAETLPNFLLQEDFPPLPSMRNGGSPSSITSFTYSVDGTPRIRVPSSVFVEASRAWEGYLIAQFYGIAPSASKIFQSLNPIWGRKGNITVRRTGDAGCLVCIPDLATREWVLEVGLWRVADVMFTLVEWTLVSSLRKPALSSAPIWITLRNIPADMYSLKGISYIASDTEKMRLDPLTIGEARIKVEVQLGAVLPSLVEIEDDRGQIIKVEVHYSWIPPRCSKCNEFGHKVAHCPSKGNTQLGKTAPTERPSKVQRSELPEDTRQPLDPLQCLSASNLFDLASRGHHFTWTNNSPENPIARKLDRAVVNEHWLLTYNDSYATFDQPGPSDHCPCKVTLNPSTSPRRRTSFKFLNSLTLLSDFRPLVEKVWNAEHIQGSNMFRISSNLKSLKHHLRRLTKESCSNIQQRVAEAFGELKVAQNQLLQNPTLESARREVALRATWSTLAVAEESYFRQKSRIRWLKEGEQNTKYFHRVVLARQATNSIRFLVNDAGLKTYDVVMMKAMAVQHYRDILGTHDHNIRCWSKTELQQILPFRCSEEDNSFLEEIPTESDIRSVVFELPKNKAPGPDGYPVEFLKSCWDLIGADINPAVKEFFTSEKILKQWNTTLISLIPKVKGADPLKNFRPISCCNTVYKIISKLLVRKLQRIMPQAVASNQTAFISGCNISENVLLAIELVADFKPRDQAQKALLKVDLSKAFDSVHWEFLLCILQALNLPGKFVGWIRECITTPTFSISFNGESTGFFEGKRGLRQGDPLSPHLFVLVMDVLSRLLDRAVVEGRLMLPPKCRSPMVSHLCFADDILVFSTSSPASLAGILRLFEAFHSTSGMGLNKQKIKLFVDGDDAQGGNLLAENLGVSFAHLPVRYLGLPLSATKLGHRECANLQDIIRSRMCSWTSRHLSFAGRLQLIKSVIFSVINFWASAFVLPTNCVTEIERMCGAFLWSGAANTAKGAKVSWRNVCQPKEKGGLGLRRLSDWNKLGVEGASKAEAYGEESSALQGPRQLGVNRLATVAEAVTGEQWVLPPARTDEIQSIHIAILELQQPSMDHEDRFYWSNAYASERLTQFSTAKAWKHFQPRLQPVPWHNEVWFANSIPKHSFIVWIAAKQRLPTMDRMAAWGTNVNTCCRLCGTEPETLDHLFFRCNYSTSVWLGLVVHVVPRLQACTTFMAHMEVLRQYDDCKILRYMLLLLFQATVYNIWGQRNARIHGAETKPAATLQKEIKRITRRRISSLRQGKDFIIGNESLLSIWFHQFDSL
ncbi:PREDICTED: uncharacterized protein LOC104814739 [Tarenaya hassleriana]|uniref:uncharacterized protein LOC104814739 n=1 Tax=Tarenaya hassleriana TaxID=28532 RepID=UPI00053C75C0|nr:PREDICTED: uncharacterized protein LOC104814739 [Tarenaya hassleriana]